MIYQTAFALALVAATASARLFTEDATAQKSLWESFKREHKKSYPTMEEESHRFVIFLENLKAADLRNEREQKAGGSAIHGITLFSDVSQAEFEASMLTADASLKVGGAQVDDASARVTDMSAGLVDWTGKLTTPVKNQGYCGSCWAFSATEQIESDAIRLLGSTWVLSAEQITQCTTGSFGCNGGYTEKAFTYAEQHAIDLESDYPYNSFSGKTGTCAPPAKGVVKVSTYTKVSGESAMASYVQGTGPLSVCLDASSWNSYTGGIMASCTNNVDHCVQAVGVDTSSYWKVRNSWGTTWGEAGFIRLKYGHNTCNIAYDPTYTKVVHA